MSYDDVRTKRPTPYQGIRAEVLAMMADVPLRRRADDKAPDIVEAPGRALPSVSRLELSRKRLGTICFLAPEHVPSAGALARALPATVRRRCLDTLGLETAAIEGTIMALRAVLPPTPRRGLQYLHAKLAEGAPADTNVHDGLFDIVRADFPDPGAYVRSTLQAILVFRDDLLETPTRLDAGTLAKIGVGLGTQVAAALGVTFPSFRRAYDHVAEPAFEDYAARRWIRGHQVFAALTQGLIFAINALDEATTGNRLEARAAAADLVILGLDACAAALELTGDFPAETYETVIRPSMSLPYLPKGFSGLLSADHCHLVRRMKATRPAMERLRDEDAIRHDGVVAALAGVYDSHKHVCARFVGTDKSSLLMNTECGRSSVEQLERFKTMRMRNLG